VIWHCLRSLFDNVELPPQVFPAYTHHSCFLSTHTLPSLNLASAPHRLLFPYLRSYVVNTYFNCSFLLTLALKLGHEPISRAKIWQVLAILLSRHAWIGSGLLGLGRTNFGAQSIYADFLPISVTISYTIVIQLI
jgi:hypothetical protein